jgi:GTP cyclohydrolase I
MGKVIKMTPSVITEEEIDNSLIKISKMTDENFSKDFQEKIEKQKGILNFINDHVNDNSLSEQSANAVIELIYNIISIYNDKYNKITLAPNIDELIKQIEIKHNKIDELLNILKEIDNLNTLEETNDRLNEILDKIQQGINLEKKYDTFINKYFNSFKNKQHYLFEYLIYSISNDELIDEEYKATCFNICEIFINAIENKLHN